jgi:hypothetical protein
VVQLEVVRYSESKKISREFTLSLAEGLEMTSRVELSSRTTDCVKTLYEPFDPSRGRRTGPSTAFSPEPVEGSGGTTKCLICNVVHPLVVSPARTMYGVFTQSDEESDL